MILAVAMIAILAIAIPVLFLTSKSTKTTPPQSTTKRPVPPKFLEQPKNFKMPEMAEFVPSKITITYKPEVAIITQGINQHKSKFKPEDISGGLPESSIQILMDIGVMEMERVFKDKAFVGEGITTKKPDDLSNYFLLYIDNNEIEKGVNALLKDPNIVYAEPDYIYKGQAFPDDPRFYEQWALTKIHADNAWDTTTGSHSVRVAVVDSGADLDHPDLQLNVSSGGSFMTGEQGRVAQDDNGHGTHVAGIIGAVGNNSTGVTGINWNVNVVAFRGLKNQPPSQQNPGGQAGGEKVEIMGAIDAASGSGVSVMNLSLGIPQYDYQLYTVVQQAIQNNIVVVAASGNEGRGSVSYPAGFEGVLSVGATDENDNRAPFSNYGPGLGVVAPGTNILSTWWDNTYALDQGTSMASPYVAGLAALILSVNPDLTPDQVKFIIESTAEKVGGVFYGGVGPDPGNQTGWNNFYGYGRINVGAAVEKAQITEGACNIDDAYWLATDTSTGNPPYTVGPGSSVYLETVTSGDCDNKKLVYDCFEDDGVSGIDAGDDELAEPQDPLDIDISDSDRTADVWTAVVSPVADEFTDNPNNPIDEYYCQVSVEGEGGGFVTTSSSNAGKLIKVDPSLEPSSAATPTPTPGQAGATIRPTATPLLTYQCTQQGQPQAGRQLQLDTLQCGTGLPLATPAPSSSTNTPLPSFAPAEPEVCFPNSGRPMSGNCTCPSNEYVISCKDGACVDFHEGGVRFSCIGWEDVWCSNYGDGDYCIAKPVVYLYPTKDTNIDVSVETVGNIVISDPFYPIGGWKNVMAHPNGFLEYEGKSYRELFYETDVKEINPPKEGLVIKKEDLDFELSEIITRLGLIGEEKKEFLEYWLPRLHELKSPYILFSIMDSEEKERTDKLNILPKPDTLIEFIAYFKVLDGPVSVSPLTLPAIPPQRVGFTAVEWGGVIDNK